MYMYVRTYMYSTQYKTDKLKKQSNQNARPASPLHVLKKWSEHGSGAACQPAACSLEPGAWRVDFNIITTNFSLFYMTLCT